MDSTSRSVLTAGAEFTGEPSNNGSVGKLPCQTRFDFANGLAVSVRPVSMSDSRQRLHDAIAAHLAFIGIAPNGGSAERQTNLVDKSHLRRLHASARRDALTHDAKFIRNQIPLLEATLAEGAQLEPRAIDPVLVEVVAGSRESDIFRLATTLWSVPVSSGFGRRLRFLVWDRQHCALMGLLALGDPVFNMSCRDNWIGWNATDRRERLVHIMDAFVVGAIPPYSLLIGGKLVAAMAASETVRSLYERKYGGRVSVIKQVARNAPLVMITTTSALGRSSLYNRLRLPGGPDFLRLGSTRGFGHFHFSREVFDMMRAYLFEIGHPYAKGNRFGDGPNWRLRVARVALRETGFDESVFLNHGVAREVYALPLAQNWSAVLRGEDVSPDYYPWGEEDIGRYCLERWMVPRAERDATYRSFRASLLVERLLAELDEALASSH